MIELENTQAFAFPAQAGNGNENGMVIKVKKVDGAEVSFLLGRGATANINNAISFSLQGLQELIDALATIHIRYVK